VSLAIVSVAVVRSVRTRTATAGYTASEQPIAGSPFAARVYRRPTRVVSREEAAAGVVTLDSVRAISFVDTTAPVLVGDICLIPLHGGGTERAKIERVRDYGDHLQCDLETGAEEGVV
jgi:hypothetical protein